MTMTLDAPDLKAERQLRNVENRVAVQQALDTLTDEEQLVIRALFGIGDVMPMDAYDIANTYLIPKSTVYYRRDSALSKLRAHFADGER